MTQCQCPNCGHRGRAADFALPSEAERRIAATAQRLREAATARGVAIDGDRVTERTAALLLRLSHGYLKRLRHEGDGPIASRIPIAGCRYAYAIADLARWCESRREDW